MPNSITSHLAVTVCEDASDAMRHGFLYREPVYKAIEVKHVVVVRKGMQSGRATVDFVLQDESGQKYVFLITGALLRSLPLGDGV